MKILLVSFLFAPANVIGAVRVTKMAEFLTQQGHEVKRFNPNDALRRLLRKLKLHKNNVGSNVTAQGQRSFLAKLYSSFVCIPDNQWGWIRPAVKCGDKIIEDWRPDIILTSGGPFSAFIATRILSAKHKIPWVADYRDLWSLNHAYPYFQWREKSCLLGFTALG